VCQVGDLFGLNTGRGPCRGPCRLVFRLRLGEPQCLGLDLQILRVSDPHIVGIYIEQDHEDIARGLFSLLKCWYRDRADSCTVTFFQNGLK